MLKSEGCLKTGAYGMLSSWKKTIVFDCLSIVGASMSSGRAFCAPSVGAFVKCKKPIYTIVRRNSTQDATMSGRLWPLIKIPFLAVSSSKPISCSQVRAVSTEAFCGNPDSREWNWKVTFC